MKEEEEVGRVSVIEYDGDPRSGGAGGRWSKWGGSDKRGRSKKWEIQQVGGWNNLEGECVE